MDPREIIFRQYDQHMVTIGSYEDVLEVLDDLAEIAEDIRPEYPLLRLANMQGPQ